MQDNMIDHLHYKQWTSTDRSNLETVFQTVADFLDSYEASIQRLLLHKFNCQTAGNLLYLQNMKASMDPGVVLVITDFAENYSFMMLLSHSTGIICRPQSIHLYVIIERM